MQQTLYIILGWLLGLLSPAIVERIRRKYKAVDLRSSILSELRELQYMMALVIYNLQKRAGLITDELLDWLDTVVSAYDGPNAVAGLALAIAEIRRIPQDQRQRVLLAEKKPQRGVSLKEYSVPFLSAQIGELYVCPLDFQRKVLRIKGQLDLFNQHTRFLQAQFERTFGATADDRDRLVSNLDEGYEQLAIMARKIADAIAALE